VVVVMKSLPKGIIRGADVEGIIFCSSKGGGLKQGDGPQTEDDDLKALELFWYNKGKKEGREEGLDEEYKKGQQEGYEKGLSEGKTQGFEEGIEKGKEEGFEEAESKIRADFLVGISILDKASQDFNETRNTLFDKAKPEFISLAIEISKKVLQQELNNPSSFSKLIETLLMQAKAITHNEVTNVTLSPEDYEMLEGNFELIKFDKNDITKLDFISDPNVKQGQCRIETSMGLVNFDIDRQLKNIEEDLLGIS
jgi:flagellar assembly protein FliH